MRPTFTETGLKSGVCTVCDGCPMCNGVQEVELPAITLSNDNIAHVDYLSNFISGFNAGSTSISDYFAITNEGYSVACNKEIIATGSVIKLSDGETVISEFTAVIFGDVNGDGWYDGTDSIIVSCLANGLLTKDDVGEVVYAAADCNHDGVIDQLDIALLEQAGILLTDIDQTKSSAELVTDEAYAEYISLIDQTPDTDNSAKSPEGITPNSLIDLIIAIIKYIFEILASLIA